jgi:hypothetical protein
MYLSYFFFSKANKPNVPPAKRRAANPRKEIVVSAVPAFIRVGFWEGRGAFVGIGALVGFPPAPEVGAVVGTTDGVQGTFVGIGTGVLVGAGVKVGSPGALVGFGTGVFVGMGEISSSQDGPNVGNCA